MNTSSTSVGKERLVRAGRIALGIAVGASFGIAVGALVASWIWGVEAIESEAVNASYLAGAITLLAAAIGGFFGFRSGRGGSAASADFRGSDPTAPRN